MRSTRLVLRRAETMRRRAILRALAAVPVCCLCITLLAQAQQPERVSSVPADLGSQNLSRVAASATEIEAVLRTHPGLMVELKRWVAKQATDRGQMVEDEELTQEGIFHRLEIELSFRAIATRLLQRYGYLTPQAYPGSEAAFEEQQMLLEKQKRLQRALAQQEQFRVAEKAAEAKTNVQAERKQQRITAPLAPAVPPITAPSINPMEEALPGGPSLQRARTGWPEGSTSGQADLIAASTAATRGDDSRTVLAGQLVERGQISPAPPEKSLMSPAAQPVARVGDASGLNPDHPPLLHWPNPYAEVPSLYDMYRQVSARPAALRLFGLDVFQNGVPDASQLPTDLPAGPDYVVGPGDGLEIDLWGGVAQRLYRLVDREGRLSLPEVGPLLVSGRTLSDVQHAIQQVLRTQYREVSADVSLSRLRSIRVYVVGEVENPGAYDISSLSTPLNALFAAGGVTPRGSLRSVRHFRGKQLVDEVDVYDLLLHGVRGDMARLETGDTLLVPPIGPKITVEGMVRRPAIYELRHETNLEQVIELAGGILPTASLRHIEVQRVEEHQKHTMLSLNIAEGDSAAQVDNQLQAFAVRGGDVVHIFPIAPYNEDAVYLEGHVLRPGKYSFRPGMMLTDLVSSYADLLPEPEGKYAEIIRLNPPDGRPSVESFNLAAALKSPASAPKLERLDTVRIFSRYDFEEPPEVSVGGEVRKPGEYRTTGQAHVRDAVYLAGGVTLDASLDTAQLIRSAADGTLKIENINLREALAGNPLDNLLLRPRDRIVVQRMPSRVDPPSVFIRGEVAKPGRYPLTDNLRVEDLIRLAGGLKRSAYSDSADLTRYSPGSPDKIATHREVRIFAALAGDSSQDLPLHDGDILTIRQKSGWNDIGASVTVSGEVTHPGTYGIRPGEKLSSVLHRAGGFLPTAYPQGSEFERIDVRKLQEKNRNELIARVEQQTSDLKTSLSESTQDQLEKQQAAMLQRQRVLETLRNAPVTGRLVIHLTRDLSRFARSPDDVAVRNGDYLLVPKRPDFVVVAGQVFNANAIAYEPNKHAGWYLEQAGGATSLADKKNIFILRADGSVTTGNRSGWWGRSVLSSRIKPGDSIIVPERPIGRSGFWKGLLQAAAIAQSASITSLAIHR